MEVVTESGLGRSQRLSLATPGFRSVLRERPDAVRQLTSLPLDA